MIKSHSILKLSCDEIEILDWREFRTQLMAQLKSRARLVSFFACTNPKESFYLNAVTLDKGTGLEFFRTELDRDGSFPSFTRENPLFHCFEREIFEQSGVRPAGHPWLKPVREQISTYPSSKWTGRKFMKSELVRFTLASLNRVILDSCVTVKAFIILKFSWGTSIAGGRKSSFPKRSEMP